MQATHQCLMPYVYRGLWGASYMRDPGVTMETGQSHGGSPCPLQLPEALNAHLESDECFGGWGDGIKGQHAPQERRPPRKTYQFHILRVLSQLQHQRGIITELFHHNSFSLTLSLTNFILFLLT